MATQKRKSQIPDWAKVRTGNGPRWGGVPRQYRFDGEAGTFAIGHEIQDQPLQVQILDWRWIESARWGRPMQAWLDLLFVDAAGWVGILPLKKESAINLYEFLTVGLTLSDGAINPAAVRVPLYVQQWGYSLADDASAEGRLYHTIRPGDDWTFVDKAAFDGAIEFIEAEIMTWTLTGETGDVG